MSQKPNVVVVTAHVPRTGTERIVPGQGKQAVGGKSSPRQHREQRFRVDRFLGSPARFCFFSTSARAQPCCKPRQGQREENPTPQGLRKKTENPKPNEPGGQPQQPSRRISLGRRSVAKRNKPHQHRSETAPPEEEIYRLPPCCERFGVFEVAPVNVVAHGQSPDRKRQQSAWGKCPQQLTKTADACSHAVGEGKFGCAHQS